MGANRSRLAQRLVEKDISNQVLHDRMEAENERLHNEELAKLRSEVCDLKDNLCRQEKELSERTEKYQDEKQKNFALLFCDLPLTLISDPNDPKSYSNLSKSYPMITLAQCDVVGFASLSCLLKPSEAIALIDRIQAIIDEAFKDESIFIMERFSDGCIAASGLIDQSATASNRELVANSRMMTPSQLDSLLGSDVYSAISKTPTSTRDTKSPVTVASYAGLMATGALKLMSLSGVVKVPSQQHKQLQLRIALHSGPCSAGIIHLQTTVGTQHMAHYKLFGPALNMTKKLCSTGLALQIRVSKQCWELLNDTGGYRFERCPDFMNWSGQKPIESFWLVGKDEHEFPLPSLDQAISLSEYEDIVI